MGLAAPLAALQPGAFHLQVPDVPAGAVWARPENCGAQNKSGRPHGHGGPRWPLAESRQLKPGRPAGPLRLLNSRCANCFWQVGRCRRQMGMAQNTPTRGRLGFGPWFHFPSHFGVTRILAHSQIWGFRIEVGCSDPSFLGPPL